MGDTVVIGLAAWALTWLLSFWYRTERLRESLGIYFVCDSQGEPTDREDKGGLSSWVNCPQCAALITAPMAFLVSKISKSLARLFAVIGLVVLAVRWYESARPKARWWE